MWKTTQTVTVHIKGVFKVQFYLTTSDEHKVESKVSTNIMIFSIFSPFIVVKTNRISASPYSTALRLCNLQPSLITVVKRSNVTQVFQKPELPVLGVKFF